MATETKGWDGEEDDYDNGDQDVYSDEEEDYALDGDDIPENVSEYLQEFAGAVKRGHEHDINRHYDALWHEYTERYYSESAWPAPADVENIVKPEHRAFMVLYRLQYYRHLTMYLPVKKIAPSLQHHVQAWEAYVDFFATIMDPAVVAGTVLPPAWLYDILSEFIYQCQAFAELRVVPKYLTEEEQEALHGMTSEWNVMTVLAYLHSLVERSDIVSLLRSRAQARDLPPGLMPQLGYFSLVCLCRLHAQLCDYSSALRVIEPLNLSNEAIFSRVPVCHVMLFYYRGFSLMMSRRYSDALKNFSRILLFCQRIRQTQPRSSQNGLISKKTDQMLALLAVCKALCPDQTVDDQVHSLLKKVHDDKLKRMDGAGAIPIFKELIDFGCPSFLVARVGHSDLTSVAVAAGQTARFMADAEQRISVLPNTRSYLRLYTNIDTEKLATFLGVSVDAVHTQLVSLKLASYQNVGGADTTSTGGVDPLQFFVADEMVHITQAPVVNRSGEFFYDHIQKFVKVMRDVSN